MLQRPQASKKNYSRPQPASAGRGQPSYILHTARAEKKKRRAPLAPRVRSVCFFPHECIAIDYCTVDSMITLCNLNPVTHHRRGGKVRNRTLRGTHLPERRPEGKGKESGLSS